MRVGCGGGNTLLSMEELLVVCLPLMPQLLTTNSCSILRQYPTSSANERDKKSLTYNRSVMKESAIFVRTLPTSVNG